jgi:integrase
MGLYKRTNGIYYFSKTIDGKRFKKSLRTKNRKEAKQRAKVLERKWYDERYNIKPSSKNLGETELIKRFFQEKHFNSKGTKRAYRVAVERKKDTSDCNENSMRFMWRHLKAIYNWGIKKGYVNKNPYEGKPTNSKPNVDYYTDSEVEKIFDKLIDDKRSDIIRFAFLTGARRGELANLSHDDVNEHSIILDGKTGRRPFPITPEIKKLIDKGRIFNYRTTRGLETALKVKGLTATKIRHTFATRLVKNGMDLYRVAKLMGHKSVKTTEKYYAHLKPTDIEDYGDYLGY